MPTYRKNESNRQMDQFEQSITEGQVYIPGESVASEKAVKLTTGIVPPFRAGVMSGSWNDKDTKSDLGSHYIPDVTYDILTENGGFLLLETGGKIVLESIIL